MTSLPDPASETEPAGWWSEINRLDLAVYAAIAATPTPTLDRAFRRLSRAADHSKLWLASAALLAATGGVRGRRAAINGLAATVDSLEDERRAAGLKLLGAVEEVLRRDEGG